MKKQLLPAPDGFSSAPFACLFLLLVALLSSSALASGEPLDSSKSYSLEELMLLGQQQNPDLQVASMAVEGLRWENLAAWGRLLPSVSAAASFGRAKRSLANYENNNGEVIELPTAEEHLSTGSSVSLSLNQTLFAGFANTTALKRALLAQQDVVGAESGQQLQFRHDLKQAAHAVLAAESRMGTEETLLGEREKQLELAGIRLQVGKGTELDVLQMQIDVGRQQVNLAAARQEHQSAWDRLALLLGAAPGPPGRINMDFSVFEPAWESGQLIAQALEHREDFLKGQRALRQAHLQTIEARAGYMPQLNLRLGHSRSEQRSGYESWEPYPKNYDNSASLSLQIPLFQGFSTLNNLQSSRIAERRSAVEQDRLERIVRAEIREALLRLQAAWGQSRITESNVELATRSLSLERERYALGLSSLLQVQSAETTWRQAQNDHLAQRLTFRDRLAALELAVGGSLEP